MAEQAWEAIMGNLRVPEAAAGRARAEAERLKQAPDLRGQEVRWLVRYPAE